MASRFVYSPKIWAFVKRDDNEILDLTRYIVSGNVTRRLDAASSAELAIRNPYRMWTNYNEKKDNPAFRPMDVIQIYMQRHDTPMQVFTGYLDRSPFYQLYPGVVTLYASCTLKRLQYTYFDSGLPYMWQFLAQYGWRPDSATGTIINENAETSKLKKTRAFTDSGIGELLFGTVNNIGKWDANAIYVEQLPRGIASHLTRLFFATEDQNKEAHEEFLTLLEKYISVEGGIVGGATSGDRDGGGTMDGNYDGPLNKEFPAHFVEDNAGQVRLSASQITTLADKAGLPGEAMMWVAKGESGFYPGIVQHDPGDGNVGTGLFQITPNAWNGDAKLLTRFNDLGGSDGMRNPWHQCLMAKELYDLAGMDPWNRTRYEANADAADLAYRNRGGSSSNTQQNTGGSDTTGTSSEPSNNTSGATKTAQSLFSPIKGLSPEGWPGSGGAYGAPRSYGAHAGVDVPSNSGDVWYAMADGVVTATSSDWAEGSGLVIVRTTQAINNYPKGVRLCYGGTQSISVEVGQPVKGGTPLGTCGTHGSGPHLHFFIRMDDTPSNGDTTLGDPTALVRAAAKGEQPSGGPGSDGGGGPGSSSIGGGSGAFAAQIVLPTLEEYAASNVLQGQKSLMNDKPLLPFVQQLCGASLRRFQSLPDGRFFAFYPDYFGEFNKDSLPYWEIDDVEILDGNLELTDDNLVSHSYVVGETNPIAGGLPPWDKVWSSGVINVFNVFREGVPGFPSTFDGLKGDDAALAFLARYGARPDLHEAPMIRSPFFELLLAWQRFMQAWSQQFLTEFTFTFMPEIYPGGKVGFKQHGIQVFIESVTHSFDYSNGFTTTAEVSAPSAYGANEPELQASLISNAS